MALPADIQTFRGFLANLNRSDGFTLGMVTIRQTS